MQITLNIDEQAIEQAALNILVDDTVKDMQKGMFGQPGGRYDYMRKLHRENVQREVREMLKQHETEIIDRAVTEAAAILARKALPKMMERLDKA